VQGNPDCDRAPVPVDQAVQDDRPVAGGRKLPHAMASDVTRAPDDKYVH